MLKPEPKYLTAKIQYMHNLPIANHPQICPVCNSCVDYADRVPNPKYPKHFLIKCDKCNELLVDARDPNPPPNAVSRQRKKPEPTSYYRYYDKETGEEVHRYGFGNHPKNPAHHPYYNR